MGQKKDVIEFTGYRTIMTTNKAPIKKRIMIGVPTTGLVRAEWMHARYGQVIPCNWSFVEYSQYVDQYSPMNFLVANARNIIVKNCVELGFEWLLFIDSDVILPPTFMLWVNQMIIKGDVPIFSGLYFTKSVPSEPLIYRGRGNGYYADWKIGDRVWVDGIGMGSTVIHGSVLRALYEESPEYKIGNIVLREVFTTPTRIFYDPETNAINHMHATEDLTLCTRIMDGGFFEKAGWPKYQKKEFPFLIDTSQFCFHIDTDGNKYPMFNEHLKFTIKDSGKKKEKR